MKLFLIVKENCITLCFLECKKDKNKQNLEQ